ncbi:hypothetical protein ACS0TY_011577 [Phlomoides rotata]
MISDHILPIFTLIIIIYLCNNTPPIHASSQCPMDLNYVLTLPWDSSSCRNINSSSSSSSSSCCQTLTSLYGVAFAHRLKRTSLFRLPDLQTSVSCLVNFQTKLTRLHLPNNLTSLCFNPQKFVNTTNVCANIQSKNDWVSLLGPSTSLDKACKNDLYELSTCDACVVAGFRVQAELRRFDGNNSNSRGCFHYTILYAAGVVNELGPDSKGALSCIFGLPLIEPGSEDLGLVFGSIGGGLAAVVVTCLVGFWVRRSEKMGGGLEFGDEAEDNRLLNWRPKGDSLWFDIRDLVEATDMFSNENLIGKGPFGVVYRGKLPDGRMVAVKEITECDEFVREVEMISNLKHRNLVPLRGCSVSQTKKYLVYDYMMNGNLGDHLFKKGGGGGFRVMSWAQRKSIILDVANGIAYLHYGVNPPIYHRDIKPTNILLDSCMRARVGDFGLAKRGGTEDTTRVAGTQGYLAPEYALYGQLTEKSDVYSFGIMVLEIMSRRKALESKVLITDWAWLLVKDGSIQRVLDPDPLLGCGDDFSLMILERFVKVGILCAHLMVALRPTILDALKMLQGDIEVPTIPDRPFYAHF